MAKCVVIGGNGFLGSHVVDELVARGHDVTVFDRFSAATQVYASAGVRQVVGDFMNHGEVRQALDGQEFVFHFLSTTTPATSENDPTLDLRTNVTPSIELFEYAVEAGVSRIYFASTGGAMYGEQPPGLISEMALPRPVSPYAIGKQAIEGYLRFFARKHGLESVSFRISNPYGPRQGPNKKQGVIPIFLQTIAEGRPVTVYGDGSMVRDYIYVADAARLIVDTVEQVPSHSLYNIGSGTGHTISDVLAIAREVTGRDVSVSRRPVPATFVERVVLDVSRYTGEFGARELVSLRDGMERTWNDTREHQE